MRPKYMEILALALSATLRFQQNLLAVFPDPSVPSQTNSSVTLSLADLALVLPAPLRAQLAQAVAELIASCQPRQLPDILWGNDKVEPGTPNETLRTLMSSIIGEALSCLELLFEALVDYKTDRPMGTATCRASLLEVGGDCVGPAGMSCPVSRARSSRSRSKSRSKDIYTDRYIRLESLLCFAFSLTTLVYDRPCLLQIPPQIRLEGAQAVLLSCTILKAPALVFLSLHLSLSFSSNYRMMLLLLSISSHPGKCYAHS